MNTPKRQHVVPCLHLRHFAGGEPAGQVWNYDATNSKTWSATPENTCVEGHFYSGEMPDGSMDTRIEVHLSKIEDLAAPVYEALLAGEIPPESQERANFAHFLGLMYSRTRAVRRMAATSYGQFMQTMLYATAAYPKVFETSIRRYEKEIGRTLSEEERKGVREAMLDPSKFKFTVAKEATFHAIAVADDLAPMFFRMNWSLLTANAGYFVTSDNPLVRTVAPETRRSFYGDGGFLNKTVEVTFPLSPKVLLFMCWADGSYTRPAPQELVTKLNELRAIYSEQYLYAHVRDAAIERLAAAFRGTREELRMQGFGPKKFGEVELERRRSVIRSKEL